MAIQQSMMKVFSASDSARTLNVTAKANPEPRDIVAVKVPPDDELIKPFGQLKRLAQIGIEADVENGCARNPRLAPEYFMTRLDVVEGIEVEFKSSLFVNGTDGALTGEQLKTIAQTIASFMNGPGGTLYFGVDDDGGVRHGLAADYARLATGGEGVVVATPKFTDADYEYKGNADSYSRKIHALVRAYLGSSAETYLGECTECVARGNRAYVKLEIKATPDDEVVYCPLETKKGTIDEIYVRNGAAKKSLWGSDRDQFIRERTRRQVMANVNAVVQQNPAGLIEQVLAAINQAFATKPEKIVREGPVLEGVVSLADQAFDALKSPKGLAFDGKHVCDVKTWKEAFGALLVKLNEIDAAKFDGIAADSFFAKWFVEVQPHRKYGDYFKDRLGTAANVRGYVKVGKVHFTNRDYVVHRLLARFGIAPSRVALRG